MSPGCPFLPLLVTVVQSNANAVHQNDDTHQRRAAASTRAPLWPAKTSHEGVTITYRTKYPVSILSFFFLLIGFSDALILSYPVHTFFSCPSTLLPTPTINPESATSKPLSVSSMALTGTNAPLGLVYAGYLPRGPLGSSPCTLTCISCILICSPVWNCQHCCNLDSHCSVQCAACSVQRVAHSTSFQVRHT